MNDRIHGMSAEHSGKKRADACICLTSVILDMCACVSESESECESERDRARERESERARESARARARASESERETGFKDEIALLVVLLHRSRGDGAVALSHNPLHSSGWSGLGSACVCSRESE